MKAVELMELLQRRKRRAANKRKKVAVLSVGQVCSKCGEPIEGSYVVLDGHIFCGRC